MLSPEEEQIVRGGAVGKRLLENEDFKAYVAANEAAQREWTAKALQPGDTDYAKGAVMGLRLALTAIHATVEEADRLLAQERAVEPSAEDEKAAEPPPTFRSSP